MVFSIADEYDETMPCSDITDVLSVELDADERLVDYRLQKRSCGALVGGEAPLLPFLFQKTVRFIADWEGPGELGDGESRFLVEKHLFALRAALDAYAGRGDSGALDSVEVHPGGVRMICILDGPALEEKLRSCGACDRC